MEHGRGTRPRNTRNTRSTQGTQNDLAAEDAEYAVPHVRNARKIGEPASARAITARHVRARSSAPLLCAGIIGYRALRLSGIKPGQRLGLYGFGASAHIAIQIARHWGCRVYVSSLKPEHQALARQLGAAWVGGAMEMPPDKLHGSIIFAPAGELVPPALRALDRGGTVALAGIHMSAIPSLDYDRDVFGERVIRSVTANTRQDGIDLLRQAAAIPIKPHTVRFPLEEANRALQELKTGSFQGAAVLAMR